MATSADPRSQPIPDWLSSRSKWVVGPSWLLSACLHCSTAYIVWQIAQSPGCQAIRGEQVSESAREVGIVVREPGAESPEQPGSAPPSAAETSPAAAPSVAAGTDTAARDLDRPPVPLALPQSDFPPLIGVDGPPSFVRESAAAAGGPLVRSTGSGARGISGTGQGEIPGSGSGRGTTMYGVAAKGSRFVYLIDRSSSMTDVLIRAKNELMASLRQLDDSQEFHVIFFNDQPRPLKHKGGLFRGTDADRRLVETQLVNVEATNGTNRIKALDAALQHKPDVIYFLTDSDDPPSSAELEEIRIKARGTQIHCIEFGVGPAPADFNGRPLQNFLHKLSKSTAGGYRYFNIAAP